MDNLWKHTLWKNPKIKFINNAEIIEYDMKNAGFSLIKKYKLLPENKIDELEKLGNRVNPIDKKFFKRKRDEEIGKLHRDNKAFSTALNYSFELARRIINQMFPIEMPYMPYIPGKPIKVYYEDFLTDKKNGDFDTIGIFYAWKTNNNGESEKININRFFKEPEGNKKCVWTEISKEEYYKRKERSLIKDNMKPFVSRENSIFSYEK